LSALLGNSACLDADPIEFLQDERDRCFGDISIVDCHGSIQGDESLMRLGKSEAGGIERSARIDRG
jgi:hypothetical protein